MRLTEAAQQTWPPFVLVTGLLLIGIVAHADGLFDRAGRMLERLPGPPAVLFAGSVLVVVLVTAVLNLDTAVVFLTPVLVLAARRRKVDERPFLYAAVYMANAASLYLPGSNLTNLLVLAHNPASGGMFAADLLIPALAATIATAAMLFGLFSSSLRLGGRSGGGVQIPSDVRPAPARGRRAQPRLGAPGLGALATLAAAVLTVALKNPALFVLGVGVLAVSIHVLRGRLEVRSVIKAVGPSVLLTLFLVSVALGVLARSWDGPAQLLAGAGRWETAAIGALTAIAVNNLPAAVLLSAHAAPHPRALLIGLNLGPNLAVTGSLCAYLWIRAARQVQAAPSIRAFSRYGVVLATLAILSALAAASALSAPS
ncbi:MAG: SLC13 family permease [Solirubrobacteraceae bacterium]